MPKQKFVGEYQIKASRKMLFPYLSTATGLCQWFADDVNINYLWESLPDKDSLKNLQTQYEFLPCAYLWSRILVYWDGLVTTCCRDYSGKNMTLGDVNKDTIKSLWNSKKMTTFRKLHIGNKRSNLKLCAKCEVSTIKKKV